MHISCGWHLFQAFCGSALNGKSELHWPHCVAAVTYSKIQILFLIYTHKQFWFLNCHICVDHLRQKLASQETTAEAELFAEVISHCRSNGLLIYSPLAGKHSWRNKWNANAIFYIEEPLVLTIVFYRPENAFYGNFIGEKPFQSNADNLKHVFLCSPRCS